MTLLKTVYKRPQNCTLINITTFIYCIYVCIYIFIWFYIYTVSESTAIIDTVGYEIEERYTVKDNIRFEGCQLRWS